MPSLLLYFIIYYKLFSSITPQVDVLVLILYTAISPTISFYYLLLKITTSFYKSI